MKKLVYSLSVAAAFVLIGCGGGGSSSTSSVTGTVEASYLAGVKVCVKGTDTCAVTDANGKFTLNVAPPVQLEIKVGETVLGDVDANSASVTVTPATLTDNNVTAAAYLGAMLHVMAGCSITAQDCNLDNIQEVDIDPTKNLPLVDELMEKVVKGIVPVKIVESDGTQEDVNVTEANATVYMCAHHRMVGETKLAYHGIASGEGYLTFEIDPETMEITYHINKFDGTVESGSEKLINLYENTFFKFEGESNSGMFVSESMAVGYNVDSATGTVTYQVGLQYPDKNLTATDISLIANKTFNAVDFDTNGSLYFSVVDINSSNVADLNGTWSSYESNGTYSGTWAVNGDHIEFKDSDGNIAAVAFLKPGVNRAALVYASKDGTFGIGVEAKPLSESELKTTFNYEDVSKDANGKMVTCFGKVTVEGTNFSYKDDFCSDNEPENGSGTLVLNPSVDINGTTVKLNGMAQVSGTNEFVFIDSEDGYYIAVNPDTGDISIGSNHPLK